MRPETLSFYGESWGARKLRRCKLRLRLLLQRPLMGQWLPRSGERLGEGITCEVRQ